MPGNALHRLFAFAHPHVKHVVAHSLHAAGDEDEANTSCLSDEQFLHLRDQTLRISQGEDVDRISALLPAESSLKPAT
jgi:hypothetical protein